MTVDRVRSRSLWLDTCGDDLTPRPALGGDIDADVAIVGGGMTGLWTALSLAEHQPDCRIVVIEAEVCGFGASGRNGGWCSALFPTSLDRLAVMAGRDAAIGQEGAAAKQVLDNPLVARTPAWTNDKVVYLDGSDWYTIGFGLDSTERMVKAVQDALS